MKRITIALCLGAASCAHVVPKELADARQAYARTSQGPANELTPSDVHKAKIALEQAEKAFADEPEAQETKDLAYVAQRRAQLAEVLALQAQDERDLKKTSEAQQAKNDADQRQTKSELASTKQQLEKGDRQHQADSEKLMAERIGRQDAEDKHAASEAKNAETAKQMAASDAKNKELELAMAKLAAFKEDARGLVLTLSGGVLFVSNQATLLPTAQTKLEQIAEALMSRGATLLEIEGHTDSHGTDAANTDLSQRRADAVRTYMIGRGYPAEKIRAKGKGESTPIASNSSAEGRANNRRVEIVVSPN